MGHNGSAEEGEMCFIPLKHDRPDVVEVRSQSPSEDQIEIILEFYLICFDT